VKTPVLPFESLQVPRMISVLYAEDEPDDIFFMERAFKEAGIEQPLYSVPDGQEVIAYLSGAGQYADRTQYPLPGLILLDINMPQMSGLDVLKWIRATPAVCTTPVLVLSSSSHEKDVEQASLLGANGYLTKPGQPDRLVEIVRAFKDYWLVHDYLVERQAQPG
jgi:CheY-like chemotaxis protein